MGRHTAPSQRRGGWEGLQRRAWLMAQVAAGAPCYWGCERIPTTVDHLLEQHAQVVDPKDPTYWVPACRPCNSQRGREYQMALTGGPAQMMDYLVKWAKRAGHSLGRVGGSITTTEAPGHPAAAGNLSTRDDQSTCGVSLTTEEGVARIRPERRRP